MPEGYDTHTESGRPDRLIGDGMLHRRLGDAAGVRFAQDRDDLLVRMALLLHSGRPRSEENLSDLLV